MTTRWLAAVMLGLLSSLPVAAQNGDAPQDSAAQEKQGDAIHKPPQIIAHRGASKEFPECTLPAIRGAIESGATAVEVDVRRTRDGHLVLMHDETVDRTTTGKGRVRDLTLAGILALDAGSWFKGESGQPAPFSGEKVPTLEECLKTCRGRIDVMLDLKETGDDYLRLVHEQVRQHGEPSRIIVGVRSVEQAMQMRRLMPQARQIGLINRADDIEAFAEAGVEFIRVWKKDPPEYVPRIRRTGKKLHINLDDEDLRGVPDCFRHRPDSVACDSPATLLRHLTDAQNRIDSKTR